MGRLGQSNELNGLAVFLSSDASKFVTGANILVDVSRDSILLFGSARSIDLCRVDTPFTDMNILTTNHHCDLSVHVPSK